MNQTESEFNFQAGLSPYAEQLRIGFKRLLFSPTLETTFRHSYSLQNLNRIRFSALSAFILFIAFGILDYYTLPPNVKEWTLPLRLFFAMPALLITWAITYHKKFQHYFSPIVFTTSLIGGLSVVGIVLAAHAQQFNLPYEGLILVTMYIYFLTGLVFRVSLLCSFLVFLAFIAVELIAKIPTIDLVYSGFFLFCANLIGAIGCYVMEYSHRKDYLHSMLLEEYAKFDGLTGIYNRRMFDILYDRLWRQAYREKKSITLLLIDVDYFKPFNDFYGHPIGDLCLKQIANILNENAKRPLDFAARYGGEEFAVVLYDAKTDYINEIAEAIRQQVEALAIPHAKSKIKPIVTISIGGTSIEPSESTLPAQLIVYTDKKLYEAKAAGRNRVILETIGEQATTLH